jgi:molybdopterin molybdotransferase
MLDIDLAQHVMLAAGVPDLQTEEVPLSKAVGRVLAEPLAPRQRRAKDRHPTDNCASSALDAGIRLQGKHMPQLAATRRPTVRVFKKLRVGVLTLGDSIEDAAEAGPARDAGPSDSSLAGPMLASLLEGLGAVSIAAPRVDGDGKAVRSVLDMLLNECSIVLVAGRMTPQRRQQMQQGLSTRDTALFDWRLCDELGARLSVATTEGKVIIGLPCGLSEAFMSFMLLISPLIRRLQGRNDLLPSSRVATVHRRRAKAAVRGEFRWAREMAVRSEISVHARANACPIDSIACSDGIARDMHVSASGEVVDALYYPFATWLH